MDTVRDLLSSSARLIGVLASGESLGASEANNALEVLNSMLDNWSAQSLNILANTIEELALVPNQQTYTIGTSGNFNTARPVRILNASIKMVGSENEIPLDLRNIDQWAAQSLKDTASELPQRLYYDPAYPLGTIYLWPKPSTASTLVLYSQKPLTRFASINTALSLAPGYEKAIRFNLAVDLAIEYGKQLRPDISQTAIDTLADIKRLNTKPIYMVSDPAAQDRGHVKRYNIYTGGYE